MIWVALASAALAAAPEVSAQPTRVLLGTDHQVQVEVHAADAPRLKAYASTGTLSPRQLLGPGAVRFTWTPPDVRYPSTAVLIFWTERGSPGPPELGVLRIPLLGRTELEVNTEPHADVRVEVGDRTFGPRRADARGHVTIPVEVPPGVAQAKALTEVGGSSKTALVPLGVPPSNRLAAVAGPATLPRSGGWAWLVSAGPLDLQALEVSATGAVVALTSSEADEAVFQVRPSPDAQTVSITFRTSGAPDDLATVGLDVAEPPAAAPHPVSALTLVPGGLLGATYGGGANLSAVASVELGVSFPPFGSGFAAGVALEGNTLGLSGQAPGGLGELDSWVVAFSPLAVARLQVFELGAAAFHVRAGVGPILFVHQVRSTFEASFTESGISLQAFVGVEVSHRMGPLELLVDLRGGMGRMTTPRLDANIGGLVIAVGARVQR